MATGTEVRVTHAALLDSQRRVLELIAGGVPLAESMDMLVRLIERHAPGMRCCVLLADLARGRLKFVAGPSVPDDYVKAIQPHFRIGLDAASCGIAAYLRKPVYTEDTAKDPIWKKFRDVALRNGFRAIWSTPVLGDDNEVLGTFAMFYGEPRLPSPEHVQLIDMAVQMARVAIEAKRGQEALHRSEETLRRNQELFLMEAERIGALLDCANRIDAASLDRPSAAAESFPAVRPKVEVEQKALNTLTAKERAIFTLITDGRSNVEVAETLHLSPRTVETYRARLMEKLQVEDVVGLVKFAIRNGITGTE